HTDAVRTDRDPEHLHLLGDCQPFVHHLRSGDVGTLESRPRLAKLTVQIAPQMLVSGSRDAERRVDLSWGVADGQQSRRSEFTKEGLWQVVLGLLRIHQNRSRFVL